MQENTQSPANEALVKEMLDIIANDSENLERMMKWLTDDCVWVMEPGGTEYLHRLTKKKLAMAGVS